MSRMMEHIRWTRKQKKKRLKEMSAVPKKIDIRDKGKKYWKAFQHMQDEMQSMFPDLVKDDTKEVKKNELRSDKRSEEDHRDGYY